MQLTPLATGLVLFVVTSFVSLAIFAINSKINQKHLEQRAALLELELQIEREYVSKPHLADVVGEFKALVARLEAQVNLVEQINAGFSRIHACIVSGAH